MERLVVTLCAAIAVLTSAAEADEIAERRDNLLTLSLSPGEFEGKTLEVRCPMFLADINGFACVVVNSSVETVGTIAVLNRHLPADIKRQTVERCAAATVKDSCVANLSVTVTDEMVYARSLEWTASSTASPKE